MASLQHQFLLLLFIYVLVSPASTDNCDYYYGREEAKEAFNRRTILNFYDEAFTNPQNFGNAARKYLVAQGYIQHNPIVADGREALIAAFQGFIGNSTRNPIDFIARIAADGDLVWVHERDSDNNGNQFVRVNIYKLDCGQVIEHWDVIQPIIPNATYANSHPFF